MLRTTDAWGIRAQGVIRHWLALDKRPLKAAVASRTGWFELSA